MLPLAPATPPHGGVAYYSWGIRTTFHSLIALLFALLLAVAVYLKQNCGNLIEDRTTSKTSGDLLSRCNLFSGKWVFDNKSYPLYKEQQCSFLSDQLACQKFGRKDLSYQNWRWQPHQCDLPRFYHCLCFMCLCLYMFFFGMLLLIMDNTQGWK